MPMTGPSPAAAQARASSASTRVLPDPAGRVDHRHAPAVGQHRQRRRGLVLAQPRTPCAAVVHASRARPASASSSRARSAPSARAASRAGQARRALGAAPARPCAPPSPAARGWRTARRRAAGRRCARRRAAGRAEPRPARAPPGTAPARTPSAAPGPPGPPAARRAAGSRPVRGSTRPRYLTRSARVQVLFSCCASATRLLRGAGQLQLVRDRARASRARARASRAVRVPHRRRDRRERDAERARELVRPALRAAARSPARLPCALRVAKFDACASCASSRCDGARPYRCSNRAARSRRSAVIDSRREENSAHHLPADALDLEPVPVVAGRPLQAEPAGQRLLQVLGGDRADRADVLVVAEGVRGPPLPVVAGPGDVGDLGVDVQLHVAVPGGVLQPVRHRQVRLVPLAGLPAVDPRVVRAGAGVAGLPLEVVEARACTACEIIASTSATSPDQYSSPAWSPASRASRAFSPREAWKIEIDFDSDKVRSKNSGLCRAWRVASSRSSCLRSAVACGSAASRLA